MAIKYKWLADQLKTEIRKLSEQGIYKLPTEAFMCKKYHVSRQTVRDAQNLLINEGLIEKVQGSGTFIVDRTKEPGSEKILIMIPDENRYIYPTLLADIKNTLSASGFDSVIYNTESSVTRERDVLTAIINNKIKPAGIITEGVNTALPNPNTDLYRRIIQLNIPIVFTYEYFPKLSGECHLSYDDSKGLVSIMQFLLAEGHTKIGGIYSRDDYSGISRYEYHLRYLMDNNLPVSDDYFCWYDKNLLGKIRNSKDPSLLAGVISNISSKCTAIICQNDEMAYYLSRTGADLAVAAFDRSYLSAGILNSVASLDAGSHEYGTRLAEMIIAKTKGRNVYSDELPRVLKYGNATI